MVGQSILRFLYIYVPNNHYHLRLGPNQHTTQYSLKPLPVGHFPHSHAVVSVSTAQDHTVALTSSGEVFTWGLNRFGQLGYVVEPPSQSESLLGFGKAGGEVIQSTPRKVHGALKKEFVIGVVASKACSACWTRREVFTWGRNNGQLGNSCHFHLYRLLIKYFRSLPLGYDKATSSSSPAQSIQTLPRKVTKITKPALSIALTDWAMACLVEGGEVICVSGERTFKIK